MECQNLGMINDTLINNISAVTLNNVVQPLTATDVYMLKIECSSPITLINLEYKCYLTVVSNGKQLQISVDFGEGTPEYYTVADDTIMLRKVYQQKGNKTIITKIISSSLIETYDVLGTLTNILLCYAKGKTQVFDFFVNFFQNF